MRAWFIVCGLLATIECRGQSLHMSGMKFSAPEVPIIWSAPSNALARELVVYREVPRQFSEAVISNALAIGSFGPAEKVRLSRKEAALDRSARVYKSADGSRYLAILPRFGWMTYYNSKAQAGMKEPLEGVPSDAEVRELAWQYLERLGVDRSQVAEKPKYLAVGRRGKVGRDGGKLTEEVTHRGIFLVRRIDGVNVFGDGGLSLDFGNQARVMDFKLSWRNLVPAEKRPTADPEMVLKWVKSGKAIVPLPNWDAATISGAKRLVVVQVVPYYLHAQGDEPQGMLYPFVHLDMVAELDGREVKFPLHCPVFENTQIIPEE